MRFNRIAIIEACDYIISTHEAKEARRKDAYEKYLAEHKAKWIKEEIPHWKEYRDSVTRAINKAFRTGEPISHGMLPLRALHYQEPYDGSSHFSYNGELFSRSSKGEYEAAERIRRILSLATDDNISVSELKTLRIAPLDITHITQIHRDYLLEQERLEKLKNAGPKDVAEKIADGATEMLKNSGNEK